MEFSGCVGLKDVSELFRLVADVDGDVFEAGERDGGSDVEVDGDWMEVANRLEHEGLVNLVNCWCYRRDRYLSWQR